jgi:hypothetical protein
MGSFLLPQEKRDVAAVTKRLSGISGTSFVTVRKQDLIEILQDLEGVKRRLHKALKTE